MISPRYFLTLPTLALIVLGTALAAPDDLVEFNDPALPFHILQQYQFEQLPDPPPDENSITEAHMAQLTKLVPHEYTTAPFGARDLTGLEFAINMERIDLSVSGGGGGPIDLAPLVSLSSLKELSLGATGILDINTINSIPSLETLNLFSSGINIVPDFSNLTNLKSLNLSRNILTDISNLQHLPALESLVLNDNLITDLSPLSGLAALKALSIRGNRIDDLTPLSGLMALEELRFENNAVTDLTPLANLTNLTFLHFNENWTISDLSPLVGLTKLDYLSANSCDIADLSPLANLSSLATLSLVDNEVTDLTPISNLISLWVVNLRHNLLETLPSMDAMVALAGISLTNNFLDPTPSDPASIAIAAMRLRGVQVSDHSQNDPYALEFDPELKAAIRLALSKPIGFLSPADLASLTVLTAQGSNISSLMGIEHAVNLERLDLTQNSIRDLSPLEVLTKLTHLDLTSNQIIDLSPLAGMTTLVNLDIASNGIVDITPLANLTALDAVNLDVNGLNTAPGSATADVIAQLEVNGTSVDVNGQTWPVAVFADAALRQAVVTQLGIEEVLLITPEDLTPLRRLIVPRAGVSNLTGIELATNLEALQVSNNAITDLSPIAPLIALEFLDISGNAGISDLSPLASLTELQYLDLNGLPTSDLGALSGMTKLERLVLDEVTEPAAIAIVAAHEAAGTVVYEAIPITSPEPAELAITKFHYRPAAPDAPETEAGFGLRSDFEYVIIKNLAGTTIDLRSMSFNDGVRFHLGDEGIYQNLPPGYEIAVVGNAGAFDMRYGTSIRFRVAGEYEGKLADEGEQIALYSSTRGSIRSTSYNDRFEPWPEDVFGDVPLVLIDETLNRFQDGRPEYWRVVRQPIGVFESDVYTYQQFIADYFALVDVQDPTQLEPYADFDQDGSTNVAEYAFGTSPLDPTDTTHSRVFGGIYRAPNGEHALEISHFRRFNADEAVITPETSSDLSHWTPNSRLHQLAVSPLPTTDADNASYWVYRTTTAIEPDRDGFFRLKVRLRE